MEEHILIDIFNSIYKAKIEAMRLTFDDLRNKWVPGTVGETVNSDHLYNNVGSIEEIILDNKPCIYISYKARVTNNQDDKVSYSFLIEAKYHLIKGKLSICMIIEELAKQKQQPLNFSLRDDYITLTKSITTDYNVEPIDKYEDLFLEDKNSMINDIERINRYIIQANEKIKQFAKALTSTSKTK